MMVRGTMVALDSFKSINDDYGHAGGDRILMDIVLRADPVMRGADYFAGLGGEQFAALLPETDQRTVTLNNMACTAYP